MKIFRATRIILKFKCDFYAFNWLLCLNLYYYSSIILNSFYTLLFPKLCWHIRLSPSYIVIYNTIPLIKPSMQSLSVCISKPAKWCMYLPMITYLDEVTNMKNSNHALAIIIMYVGKQSMYIHVHKNLATYIPKATAICLELRFCWVDSIIKHHRKKSKHNREKLGNFLKAFWKHNWLRPTGCYVWICTIITISSFYIYSII